MSMIRCPEGHFFDKDAHTDCPWCAQPLDLGPAGKTVAVRADGTAPARAAVPISGGQATVRLSRDSGGNDPVAGWLVCIEGPDRGRDFRLREGRNFIGRSPSMDVPLTMDDSVSRERHASVIFDPRSNEFWLAPGEGAGLVYLSGELVHSPVKMPAAGAVVEAGRSRLLLVPFAGVVHHWK